MRQLKEVSDAVLARAGRFHPVADNLEVKEVMVDGRRYVVCRNPDEARKDAGRAPRSWRNSKRCSRMGPRQSSATGLRALRPRAEGSVSIDPAAVEADARYHGKFVLRTSTALPAAEVARAYKSLWRVERTFREEKSTLEVRPIFHHRDDTSIGHIVACFLALRLEVDLQRRLDQRQADVSWPDLMRDLDQVRAVSSRSMGSATGSAPICMAAPIRHSPPPASGRPGHPLDGRGLCPGGGSRDVVVTATDHSVTRCDSQPLIKTTVEDESDCGCTHPLRRLQQGPHFGIGHDPTTVSRSFHTAEPVASGSPFTGRTPSRRSVRESGQSGSRLQSRSSRRRSRCRSDGTHRHRSPPAIPSRRRLRSPST